MNAVNTDGRDRKIVWLHSRTGWLIAVCPERVMPLRIWVFGDRRTR